MASGFGNVFQSLLDWVSASDHRYREACKMMELDDDILDDIGLTREELMEEFGIRRLGRAKARPSAAHKTSVWSGLANGRMARRSF